MTHIEMTLSIFVRGLIRAFGKKLIPMMQVRNPKTYKRGKKVLAASRRVLEALEVLQEAIIEDAPRSYRVEGARMVMAGEMAGNPAFFRKIRVSTSVLNAQSITLRKMTQDEVLKVLTRGRR